MKRKTLIITACLVLAVLSFLAQPAYATSLSQEFTVKVAETPEEIEKLLEVGFEYVCEKDGKLFFRKRK